MSKVLGDISDIDSRLREYDPDLALTYDGNGRWTVHHKGRQGRPYPVLTIGAGTGNRWPKDDPTAPEVDRPDMRVLYLIRAADLDRQGGADKAAKSMELRDMVAKEAKRARFGEHVADVARDRFAFHRRDVDGAADYRVTFPVAKAEGVGEMAAEFIPDASNTDQILLVGTQTGAVGGEKIGFRNVGKYDASQNLLVGLRNSVGTEPVITNGGLGDGTPAGTNSIVTAALSMGFNNTGYDRWRNNTEAPLQTSAARTTGTPSPDQTLFNGCGVDIIIDVTAIGPAPSVTFTIEVKDPTSGKYVAVLASPAIIAIGTYRMVVYPGIASVANKAANDRMRRTWRLTPVHTNADSITYSTSKCDLV